MRDLGVGYSNLPKPIRDVVEKDKNPPPVGKVLTMLDDAKRYVLWRNECMGRIHGDALIQHLYVAGSQQKPTGAKKTSKRAISGKAPAGKEASGTGNMKFMMNGALTIGTLDGANIEIREQVGDDNFFLFGLTAAQAQETRKNYDPNAIIDGDEEIQRVMNLVEGGHFNRSEPGIFSVLTSGLRNPHDPWLTIADLRDYIDAQQKVNEAYKDEAAWNRMSILNTASSGWFSSDRTIQQYADEIWKVRPIE